MALRQKPQRADARSLHLRRRPADRGAQLAFSSSFGPGGGDDQVALLDALEIERANVIGHDWGAWTAMLLGLDHPERIERMIVVDAPHPWPSRSLSNLRELWRSWYAGALAAPGLAPWLLRRTDVVKGILTRAAPPGTFEQAELDSYADSFRAPERARATNSLYRYYHRVFVSARRRQWRDRRLTVPTLLLFGASDLYVTAKLVDGYQPYADELRAEIVPGAGHFLMDERPELICERAAEFFG